LGPGAPAAARLSAFLAALAGLTERNLDVLLATDTEPPGRVQIGAYASWRLHVGGLLADLRPELSAADLGWLADALLGPLDPRLYAYQRRQQRISAKRIAANIDALARSLASP
jgi:hypothetical protein